MTHKLELPDGGWAEMKDSSEITRGEQRAAENSRVRAAAAAATNPLVTGETTPEAYETLKQLGDDDLQPFESFQNLMAKTCLVSWSRGALPVEPADFDAMPAEMYEAVVLESQGIIFKPAPEFGPDGVADPKAATASSNGSQPTSTELVDSLATTTPTLP
jgi:hypothetical protein